MEKKCVTLEELLHKLFEAGYRWVKVIGECWEEEGESYEELADELSEYDLECPVDGYYVPAENEAVIYLDDYSEEYMLRHHPDAVKHSA